MLYFPSCMDTTLQTVDVCLFNSNYTPYTIQCQFMRQRRSRQSKRLSPLRSWVRFSPRTHVKSVCQRPAESRGFSRGAPNPPPPPQGKLTGWAGLEISVREPSDKMFDDFEFGSDICIVMCDGL